jgi:chemotaxis signal transduction protein
VNTTTEVIAIRCSSVVFGFPLQWTMSTADDYDLVTLPFSPDWLVGACCTNGEVVPVVDLAEMIGDRSNHAPGSNALRQRLLTGAKRRDEGDCVLGLVFDGLPTHLNQTVLRSRGADLPKPIQAMVTGEMTMPGTGDPVYILDPNALYQSLTDALLKTRDSLSPSHKQGNE